MKTCIGIVTFNNSQKQLQLLLDSIAVSNESASSSDSLKIIGIDNGEVCFEQALAQTKLPRTIDNATLASQGNIGFGRAMNILMKQAFSANNADIFIAVNPDGLFHKNCLGELKEASKKYGDCLFEARQFPEEHPKPYSIENGDTLWATGACLAIPKAIFEKTGGFDENLFMYGEDVDLSWRAKAAGFGVKLVHNAIFVHPTLGRSWSREAKKHFFLSAVYLAYKWKAKEFETVYTQDFLDRFSEVDGASELLEEVKMRAKTARETSNSFVNSTTFTPFFDIHRSFSHARWSDK